MRKHLQSIVTLVTVVGVIAAFGTLFVAVVDRAPKGWRLEAIHIAPPPESVTELGWRELGQSPGEGVPNLHRLLVAHDGQGWILANGSRERTVYVQMENGHYRDLDAIDVQGGDVIESLSTARLDVLAASPHGVHLRGPNDWEARWEDGALNHAQRIALDSCHVARRGALNTVIDAVRNALRPIGLAFFDRDWPQSLFTVGGTVDCPTRQQHPGIPSGALALSTQGDGILIQQGTDDAGRFRLRRSDGTVVDMSQPWTKLDRPDGKRLVAVFLGGVRYELVEDRRELILRPVRNRALFDQPFNDLPNVSFHWEPSEEGTWLGSTASSGSGTFHTHDGSQLLWPALGAVAGILAGAGVWRACHDRWQWRTGTAPLITHVLYGAGLGALGGCAVLIAAARPAVDLSHLLWMAAGTWIWASVVLASSGVLRGWRAILWLSATVLACAGALTQLQLAAGMGTENLIDAPRKHALALKVLAVGAATAVLLPPRLTEILGATVLGGRAGTGRIQVAGAMALRYGVPLIILFGLLLQASRGAEAGLGWVQPSEAGKLLFALGLAWMATWFLFFTGLNHPATRWPALLVSLAARIGLVCLSVPLSLLLVGDMSPALILASMGVTWLALLALPLVKTSTAASPWAMLPMMVFVTLSLLVAAAVSWALLNPDDAANAFGEKVAERFAIHSDPFAHPGGTQAATALRVVAQAPLWPEPGEAFGANQRSIRLLPEVKNDMIVAFLIATFGRLAVAGLVIVQAALIISVAAIGLQTARMKGGFESRLVSTFFGFALVILTAAQAVQWLLGYSNALGGLVMGQPFTWFSSGVSHFLAFSIPILFLGFLRGGTSTDTDQGCANGPG